VPAVIGQGVRAPSAQQNSSLSRPLFFFFTHFGRNLL
jgi:hypothetical protein